MRVIRVLSVLSALAATSLVANAQTFRKVTVHLSYPVVVGSRQLAPGDYEILPISATMGKFFKMYSENRNCFEAVLSANPTSKLEAAKTTELVLRDNGRGEYTLDQMWIQGSAEGYEFLAPKSVTSRERERHLAAVEQRAESTR